MTLRQLFASGPAPSNVSYDATLLATAAAGAGAGAWRHGLQLLWQMQCRGAMNGILWGLIG